MTKNIDTNTKKLTYTAILIALSFIGSLIKVQGSIAFDSMPAFLGAILISPVAGAIIGVAGHLLTALTSGFPLTVPIHLIVAIEMGIFTFVFGKMYWKNKKIAAATLIFLNSVVGALIGSFATYLLGMEFAGKVMFYAIIGPLFFASAANTILAIAVYEIIFGEKNGRKI